MTPQNTEEGYRSKDLLKKARESRGKDFKKVLKEVEDAIEKSENPDENLLRAKKILTARMSSRIHDKEKISK
ncbi:MULTISPECIES: hypothetical protein [Methanobacterium]|uniref:Uncharacterized protein n=1 Tax=Methanobacterium bryantii TaxID=2161 RepID=A0A2A2H589_METBR|nr:MULTISPECIES: hypothetical protein [Methanobacterium]OEC88326.1 hypothetical protein A9507_05285 [Methanobacterium sp. A39]PAV04515.1 hypothetical protein ASJ80_06700 [Methanobacterium bryantii]